MSERDPMRFMRWAWPLVVVAFMYLLLYHSFGAYIGPSGIHPIQCGLMGLK